MIFTAKQQMHYLFKTPTFIILFIFFNLAVFIPLFINLFFLDGDTYYLITLSAFFQCFNIYLLILYSYVSSGTLKKRVLTTSIFLSLPISRKDFLLGNYLVMFTYLIVSFIVTVLITLSAFLFKGFVDWNHILGLCLMLLVTGFLGFFNYFILFLFKYAYIFVYSLYLLTMLSVGFLLDFFDYSLILIIEHPNYLLIYIGIFVLSSFVFITLSLMQFLKRDLV
ncbi:hypothetical protein EDC19_0984 [Natranaerovirga hydrolytica]|uniref:ABC-2 family transporter n=1 Tax=Natranaerovirga hydrolytica TaxID=680378 RepID=A0A4R1N3D6_9FIRM|nr:hypothetical protein EDC19_0984 [Natranaerovirga hydrolytica]